MATGLSLPLPLALVESAVLWILSCDGRGEGWMSARGLGTVARGGGQRRRARLTCMDDQCSALLAFESAR